MNDKLISRIHVDPDKRCGKPCILGTRITIYDIFSYITSGMSLEEILNDFDYLSIEDIKACLIYMIKYEGQN